MKVALGFDPHTGWAACVALGADGGTVEVVHRERIELVSDRGLAFAYHSAAELDGLAAAQAFVAKAGAAAANGATAGVAASVRTLRTAGHEVAAAGLPVGTTAVPDDLARILASHTLLHSAEGRLYGEALSDAIEDLGIPVVGIPAKELNAQLAAATGRAPDDLDIELAGVRASLGPPWRAEHKKAAKAAWVALLSACP